MSNLCRTNNTLCKQQQPQKPILPLVFNTTQINPQQLVKKQEDNTNMIIHKQGNPTGRSLNIQRMIQKYHRQWIYLQMIMRARFAEAEYLQKRVKLQKQSLRLQIEANRLRLKEKQVDKILERRFTRLTKEEKKSIVEDYLPFNKNITQLAKKYRVSRGTIKNYLRKVGLQ